MRAKELIDVARGGFSDMGEKTDRMLDKQDQMLQKQDETIAAIKGIDFKMDQMLDRQDETTGEVRGLRYDMKGKIDMLLERIETALKEKGILGGAGRLRAASPPSRSFRPRLHHRRRRLAPAPLGPVSAPRLRIRPALYHLFGRRERRGAGPGEGTIA